MDFENEKQFVMDALQGKHNLKNNVFRNDLDGLYDLFQNMKNSMLDKTTADTMLLTLYLRSKCACHHIQILKAVLEELLVDPFDLPYKEYSEKFMNLADDYDWWSHTVVSIIAPLWDGQGLIDSEEYERIFGLNKESLFNKTVEYAPDNSCGTLNDVLNILDANEVYLIDSISRSLRELADDLDYIDVRLEGNKLNSPIIIERLTQRKNTYMLSKYWEEVKVELYNDIKINTIVGQEIPTLNYLKINLYSSLKRNTLGALLFHADKNDILKYDLYGYSSFTQSELNEYLRISCQYELITKLLDYYYQWAVNEEHSIFNNNGIGYVINTLVPYFSTKIKFISRKSYAALWYAFIDLNLLKKTDAESFKNWVNSSFLKDAPADSSRGGRIKTGKSIREAVDDMYKFQTKEGKQKLFKDLTEDEISQLKNGDNLKVLYRDSILILAKAFELDLKKENFQSYISEYSIAKEYLSDFPEDKISRYILECFRAYEDFIKH